MWINEAKAPLEQNISMEEFQTFHSKSHCEMNSLENENKCQNGINCTRSTAIFLFANECAYSSCSSFYHTSFSMLTCVMWWQQLTVEQAHTSSNKRQPHFVPTKSYKRKCSLFSPIIHSIVRLASGMSEKSIWSIAIHNTSVDGIQWHCDRKLKNLNYCIDEKGKLFKNIVTGKFAFSKKEID